jgi:endoglucanase
MVKDMNAKISKPHDMDTNLILANDQAAINAIRVAGAKQL